MCAEGFPRQALISKPNAYAGHRPAGWFIRVIGCATLRHPRPSEGVLVLP